MQAGIGIRLHRAGRRVRHGQKTGFVPRTGCNFQQLRRLRGGFVWVRFCPFFTLRVDGKGLATFFWVRSLRKWIVFNSPFSGLDALRTSIWSGFARPWPRRVERLSLHWAGWPALGLPDLPDVRQAGARQAGRLDPKGWSRRELQSTRCLTCRPRFVSLQ